MAAVRQLFRKQTVFCISLLLAIASSAVVLPDAEYLAYPDYRTLALLFSLMVIVAGFQSLGAFARLGRALLARAHGLRALSAVLVALCFFCSMVITNDVTLITFVPFTLLVFRMIGREARALRLVVLETIAANLGSMATPIGNPQNLYLYSSSGIAMGAFMRAVLPYAALALALLLAAIFLQKDEPIAPPAGMDAGTGGALFPAMLPYLALLALCLLVVFHVLPYLPVLVCVAVVVLAVNRRLYRSVDYFLLLTFLCFFVFIGNLKRIPEVSRLLTSLVAGHELWAGVLASQVISNVPAAILLAGFTENIPALLTAVNIGGLGSLIASLASLISLQFYSREYPAQKGAFLKSFTLWNAAFLATLLALACAIG